MLKVITDTRSAYCFFAAMPDFRRSAASRRRRVWHGSWLKKGAASDEMTRLLGDAQRGSYVQPDKLTLSEWVEKRWLRQPHRISAWSDSTTNLRQKNGRRSGSHPLGK